VHSHFSRKPNIRFREREFGFGTKAFNAADEE